jgi:deazaflavin-dependent oxidoreductase (nitroreductase family)
VVERLGVDLALELDLEALALPYARDTGDAEPRQRTMDGLSLRVEDFRLEHDVDDDASHGLSRESKAGDRCGATRRVYRRGAALSSATNLTLPSSVDKARYDLTMGLVLRNLTRGHRLLHRVSGGRLGRHFPGGQQIVWVTTLGRRSGEWRTTPLLAARDVGSAADVWVVAGSNAGQAKVPGWVFNARAHVDGWVRVGGQVRACRFAEATGDDRDQLYAALTREWRWFAGYERRAGRSIPVFRVLPTRPSTPH